MMSNSALDMQCPTIYLLDDEDRSDHLPRDYGKLCINAIDHQLVNVLWFSNINDIVDTLRDSSIPEVVLLDIDMREDQEYLSSCGEQGNKMRGNQTNLVTPFIGMCLCTASETCAVAIVTGKHSSLLNDNANYMVIKTLTRDLLTAKGDQRFSFYDVKNYEKACDVAIAQWRRRMVAKHRLDPNSCYDIHAVLMPRVISNGIIDLEALLCLVTKEICLSPSYSKTITVGGLFAERWRKCDINNIQSITAILNDIKRLLKEYMSGHSIVAEWYYKCHDQLWLEKKHVTKLENDEALRGYLPRLYVAYKKAESGTINQQEWCSTLNLLLGDGNYLTVPYDFNSNLDWNIERLMKSLCRIDAWHYLNQKLYLGPTPTGSRGKFYIYGDSISIARGLSQLVKACKSDIVEHELKFMTAAKPEGTVESRCIILHGPMKGEKVINEVLKDWGGGSWKHDDLSEYVSSISCFYRDDGSKTNWWNPQTHEIIPSPSELAHGKIEESDIPDGHIGCVCQVYTRHFPKLSAEEQR